MIPAPGSWLVPVDPHYLWRFQITACDPAPEPVVAIGYAYDVWGHTRLSDGSWDSHTDYTGRLHRSISGFPLKDLGDGRYARPEWECDSTDDLEMLLVPADEMSLPGDAVDLFAGISA